MTQISLFDGNEKLKINKPIRLIELFAGYGSQSLALNYNGANYESWKICEWAVKSIQAYKDLHCPDDNTDYSNGKSKEELIDELYKLGISADYSNPMTREQIARLGESQLRTIYNNIKATNNLVSVCNCKGKDLEIVDTDKYCYVLTYSFPCQDLSNAGQGKGMKKGSGTRSGLLWEVERILNECDNKPQILLMENVPEVHGTNNIQDFAKWVQYLESIGYHCYWQDLNGKDYGIPQNRNRCFMVSCLGDYYYDFPQPIKLEKRLKDLLEDAVDEKYYLSDKTLQQISKWNSFQNPLDNVMGNNSICATVTTRVAESQDGGMNASMKVLSQDFENDTNVRTIINSSNIVVEPIAYDEQNQYLRTDGTVRTLTTDGSSPKHNNRIVEFNLEQKLCNELIEKGKVKENDVIRHSYSNSRMNGEFKDIRENNMRPTLDTRCDCLGVVVDDKSVGCAIRGRYDDNGNIEQQIEMLDEEVSNALTATYNNKINLIAQQPNYRIRKLTPRECFRLMGVRDEDFDKVAKNQSNSSLYHLAGDSIIVNVLSAIFKEML